MNAESDDDDEDDDDERRNASNAQMQPPAQPGGNQYDFQVEDDAIHQ